MKGGDVQPLVSPCEEGQDPGDGSPLAERRERGVSGKAGENVNMLLNSSRLTMGQRNPGGLLGALDTEEARSPESSHRPSLGVARNIGDRARGQRNVALSLIHKHAKPHPVPDPPL